jgi:hypothetical protein
LNSRWKPKALKSFILKVNAYRRCASIIYVLLPLNYSLINGVSDPFKTINYGN